MIINLIESKHMFSLTLPQKKKGKFWITDFGENNQHRKLVGIEAEDNQWILKSNKNVSIIDSDGIFIPEIVVTPSSFLKLRIIESNEDAVIFSEEINRSRQMLVKLVALRSTSITIGHSDENNFCYNNNFVSGKHAMLLYDGEHWAIKDNGSRNGTYVNGMRIEEKLLFSGDIIYIVGLKIVVGNNYIAVNNPDNNLKIKSDDLEVYHLPKIQILNELADATEKQYYFRSPRFYREIVSKSVVIDPPPSIEKQETVPMALMLGPSLTMGFTSVCASLISLSNAISNGGNISQALPMLIMSFSMLLGTVLWPILTKKYEKKQKIKKEKERQEKYKRYLRETSEYINNIKDEQKIILNENIVSVDECIDRILNQKSNLWERVIGQNDFLKLRLGVGTLPANIQIKCQEKHFSMDDDTLQDAMIFLSEEPKLIENAPISISLVKKMVIGIYGSCSQTENLLKSLILQMIALHSYDELKLIMLTQEYEYEKWKFAKIIPHFWSNDKRIRFFASTNDDIKELSVYMEKNILCREDKDNDEYQKNTPYYVIIATNSKLIKKCESISQLLKYKNNVGFTIIISGAKVSDFPKETKTIINVNEENSMVYNKDDTLGNQSAFKFENIDDAILSKASCKIANIELDMINQANAIPQMITFLEMFRVSKVEHLNSLVRWCENNPVNSLQTPVGVDSYGDLFSLDIHEKFHGPHGLIAGMTGSGKSEFIITYILSLAVNYHPEEVAFILIDYKGGGLTGAFEDKERNIKLPHLAGTITNLDGSSIKRSLVSIQSELRRRQAIFNEARKISNDGTMDIYKYQKLYRSKMVNIPVPHLLIIADEFAELKTQQPEFMKQLISTARIGRSLGVHLILATQKPSGIVDEQIWSNSRFRVCLKVQEKSDSQDMIKCPDAAEISQTGRFYLQVGYNELFALGQSAWCGADYFPSEEIEKTVDQSIQVVDNLGRVVLNVKPTSKKISVTNEKKQVVAIVEYLSNLAKEENIFVQSLWLEPIPEFIYIDELEQKYNLVESGYILNPIVGEYDDPFNQKQNALTVPLSTEGNCLVYGSSGNGKTTFLTTLCYSLIKNHTADEVNIYIIDYASGTLKSFEDAPHVGGVVTSSDEEKAINLFKMLCQELKKRKRLFSEYGGEYNSYYRNSGNYIPNVVVLINDYLGFIEQFERLTEELHMLTRDGVKYGIYFIVSVGNTGAIRYKTQQNFKMMFTMQQNDVSDYSVIVGKTDGLVPSKFKGRGLVALDKVYEFQTAYCTNSVDLQNFLRNFCKQLCKTTSTFAKQIPILPDIVDYKFVHTRINGLRSIPIGVSKQNLNIVSVALYNKVIFPVIANEINDTFHFVKELIKILETSSNIIIVDSEKLFAKSYKENIISDNFEIFVRQLFSDMVTRNNTYKDSLLDISSLDNFEEITYVFVGINHFMECLSDDGKDKFINLLDKAEPYYKIHFIFVESLSKFNLYSYDSWFKHQLSGVDGLWIGDGVADQYLLKVNKITSDLYEDIGKQYGYIIIKNKATLLKLISSSNNLSEQGDNENG